MGVVMNRRMHLRIVPLRIVAAILVGFLLAGCDKCGHRVKFNAPSLPDACGENSDPAR